LCVLSGVAVVVLHCSIAATQEPNSTPAQHEAAPVQKDADSQLPNVPVPSNVPPSDPLSGAAQQPSSSSSSTDTSAKPRFWNSSDPAAQVTVLEDTLFRVMTNEPLSTRQTHEGAPLLFTLSEDVVVDGVLIVPRGAAIHGTVVESKRAGALTGQPELIVKLTSLDLGGRSYPLYTYQYRVVGTSKTKPTESKIKGGAVIGALAGGVFSGNAKGDPSAVGKLAGMGTGAALGAGVGTALSAATPGPIVSLPAESQMDFHLSSPVSVVPVSAEEAARLSQGLYPGGPVLYVRGDTP
jgi:hypothetical protein